MTTLTDQLRKEHGVIVDALNEAFRLGISTPEGQKKLAAAKGVLLMHLKKEDEQLYPKLTAAAVKDLRLRSTLELMQGEMRELAASAMQFFQKYENGGSGLEFARDFGALFALLSSRIRREEGGLYKAFDTLSV